MFARKSSWSINLREINVVWEMYFCFINTNVGDRQATVLENCLKNILVAMLKYHSNGFSFVIVNHECGFFLLRLKLFFKLFMYNLTNKIVLNRSWAFQTIARITVVVLEEERHFRDDLFIFFSRISIDTK